jgi:hypothetical protein
MKNTTNKTQVQQPELPQGFSRETLKTVAVIGILVLAFLRWNDVIAILINVMIFIYGLVGQNFGVALILFTILIRLVTWPLNAQQMKGAAAMQELQNDKDWQAYSEEICKRQGKTCTGTNARLSRKGHQSVWLLPANADPIPHFVCVDPKHYLRHRLHSFEYSKAFAQCIRLSGCSRSRTTQQQIFMDGSGPA